MGNIVQVNLSARLQLGTVESRRNLRKTLCTQVLRRDGASMDKDIFVDFEKATPSEEEQEVYDTVNPVLEKAPGILQALYSYDGAGDHIRKAISNSADEELQQAAWDAVCPLVAKLKDLYIYSSEIERVLPPLLEGLCSDTPATDVLERRQVCHRVKLQVERITELFWL